MKVRPIRISKQKAIESIKEIFEISCLHDLKVSEIDFVLKQKKIDIPHAKLYIYINYLNNIGYFNVTQKICKNSKNNSALVNHYSKKDK